jgi:hypothetical protein
MKSKKIQNLAKGACAASLLALVACGSDSSSSQNDTEFNSALALVFGSDYSTGELRWCDPDSSTLSKASLSFNQDSKLVANGQYLFVLERLGADNISLVDLSLLNEGASAVKKQLALSAGANPSDIVVVDESIAWLSQEGNDTLLQINPLTLKIQKSVSLAKYTVTGNVSPNLVDLELTGDTLIALLQRLDQYSPTLPGLIVLFNASTGSLLDTVSLLTSNPTAMAMYKGKLLVTTNGAYNASYGLDADAKRGIEQVDLTQGSSKLLATGKDFGGGLNGLALDTQNGIAYVPVYIAWGDVPLKAFDLSKETVTTIAEVSDVEGSVFFDDFSENLFFGERATGNENTFVYNGSSLKSINGENVLAPYNITVTRW